MTRKEKTLFCAFLLFGDHARDNRCREKRCLQRNMFDSRFGSWWRWYRSFTHHWAVRLLIAIQLIGGSITDNRSSFDVGEVRWTRCARFAVRFVEDGTGTVVMFLLAHVFLVRTFEFFRAMLAVPMTVLPMTVTTMERRTIEIDAHVDPAFIRSDLRRFLKNSIYGRVAHGQDAITATSCWTDRRNATRRRCSLERRVMLSVGVRRIIIIARISKEMNRQMSACCRWWTGVTLMIGSWGWERALHHLFTPDCLMNTSSQYTRTMLAIEYIWTPTHCRLLPVLILLVVE